MRSSNSQKDQSQTEAIPVLSQSYDAGWVT